MSSNIAPLNGKVSLYCYIPLDSVLIQKRDYKHVIVHQSTFDYLYHQLDSSKAALKEDCIEYVVYEEDKPLDEYPIWFLDAMDEGWITNAYNGNFVFLDDKGEIAMSQGSVILRNFMGDLRYMEYYDFSKHYDVIGE